METYRLFFRNRYLSYISGMLVMVAAGTNYAFSTYSVALQIVRENIQATKIQIYRH